MTGTCRTCKHWTEPKDGYDDIARPIDEDTFEKKDVGFTVNLCEHPELVFGESPLSATGFAVMDGSGYMACLYTAENFGCVRHEAR